MYNELTLREFISEIQKHEDLMDMKVISLGGGCGHKEYGAFHSIGLKDENEKRKDLYIRYYRKEN